MEDLKIKSRLEKVKTYFSNLKDKVKGKSKSGGDNLKKSVREKGRDISAI